MRMIRMVRMLMAFIAVMIGIGLVMAAVLGMAVPVFTVLVIAVLVVVRLGGLRRLEAFRVDDLALHPLAVTASARVAMPGAAVAAGAVFGFFFRLAMRAFVGF